VVVFFTQYFLVLLFPRPSHTSDMKIILLNIAFLLLALTINLQTASSDKLRAPEPEEPTDVSGDIIPTMMGRKLHDKPHRKLKGNPKGKKGNKGSGDEVDTCDEVFSMLSGGDGVCISTNDILTAFLYFEVELTNHEADTMMGQLDGEDGDGCIDTEEFEVFCNLANIIQGDSAGFVFGSHQQGGTYRASASSQLKVVLELARKKQNFVWLFIYMFTLWAAGELVWWPSL